MDKSIAASEFAATHEAGTEKPSSLQLGEVKVNRGEFVKSGYNQLYLRESELRSGIELVYFAHRDFEAASNALLDELNSKNSENSETRESKVLRENRHKLSLDHLRLLSFLQPIESKPSFELMQLLACNKQNFSRLVKTLLQRGMVDAIKDKRDRRQLMIRITESGKVLEKRWMDIQTKALSRAYRMAGGDAVNGFNLVLSGLVTNSATKIYLQKNRSHSLGREKL